MDYTKSINWYVLFVLVEKQLQLCNVIQSHKLDAFFPFIEYYRRDQKGLDVKPWFPGYVFVRTGLG